MKKPAAYAAGFSLVNIRDQLLNELVVRPSGRICPGSFRSRRIALKRGCQLGIDFSPNRILVFAVHNRVDRAFRKAKPAADTDFRINDHKFFSLIVTGMNAFHRADRRA